MCLEVGTDHTRKGEICEINFFFWKETMNHHSFLKCDSMLMFLSVGEIYINRIYHPLWKETMNARYVNLIIFHERNNEPLF